MLQRHRHIIIFLLLFSYLLLGAVGYLETLILSGFGTNPQYLTQTRGGPPPTSKVYWTQYKHIPSTVKVEVPSPAVLTTPETPDKQTYSIVYLDGKLAIHLNPIVSLYSSRAPPQI
jgi:hypothetical protein